MIDNQPLRCIGRKERIVYFKRQYINYKRLMFIKLLIYYRWFQRSYLTPFKLNIGLWANLNLLDRKYILITINCEPSGKKKVFAK